MTKDDLEFALAIDYRSAMSFFEKEYLKNVLQQNGTIERTADDIGISRKHLHTLINKHGIVFKNGSVRS